MAIRNAPTPSQTQRLGLPKEPISAGLLEDAVMLGDTQKIAYQIAGGISPDYRSKHYGDLAAIAVESVRPDALALLLASGSQANGTNADGYPALSLAASLGRIDMAEILLSHGAHLNPTNEFPYGLPSHQAVNGNHPAMLRFLFERGAHVDIRDSYGCTPLMIAVKRDHVECIRVCLAFGANIDAQDEPRGYTPAMMALGSGSDTMRALCEHGFDIALRTRDGLTIPTLIARDSMRPAVSTYKAWRLSLQERQALSIEPERASLSTPVTSRPSRI